MGLKAMIGAAGIALLLAACGGDETNPPATGGGTPTPTPTPSPTPTYSTFNQLTGNQTFRTTCAGTQSQGGGLPVAASPFGAGVTITSDRSGPSYNLTTDGAGLFGTFALSFTQADRDTTVTTAESYRRTAPNGFTERFITLPPQRSGVAYDYARFGQIVALVSNQPVTLFCAYGVPTLLTDVPATAPTYTPDFVAGSLSVVENVGAGPRSEYLISNTVTGLTANPATGEITVRIDLKGRLRTPTGTSDIVTDFGVFTGRVTIDGTVQNFSGALVDANNVQTGQFGGWFFGPRGREAAFSFNIVQRRADNSDVFAGAVTFLGTS
jgi:hypothetical protein